MVKPRNDRTLPCSLFNIFRSVDIELVHIIGRETNVEYPFFVFKRCCPGALAVNAFSVQQPVGIVIFKGVIYIIYNFPIS
ncbi:hypothetical protein D3C73_972860 [compost metagenome]